MAKTMRPNFLFHKVGRYWYVSQQKCISDSEKIKEYRHRHFGRIKFEDTKEPEKNISAVKNNCKNMERVVFYPFMEVFCLSKEDLNDMKHFIDSKFKNTCWSVPFEFIQKGLDVSGKTVENNFSTLLKVKEKELMHEK